MSKPKTTVLIGSRPTNVSNEKATVYGKPQKKTGTHFAVLGWWASRGMRA